MDQTATMNSSSVRMTDSDYHRAREDAGSSPAHGVLYDSSDHWKILTQSFGSVWSKVLPFCLLNTSTMIILESINLYAEFGPEAKHWSDAIIAAVRDVGITREGHTLLGGIMAFLLVSRVNMALARFGNARTDLGRMYHATLELIQYMYTFTGEDTNESAKEWRHVVSYRAMLLLRTAMAVVDYPETLIPAWEISQLNGEERVDVLKNMLHGNSMLQRRYGHMEHGLYDDHESNPHLSSRDKGMLLYRSERDATMRVPIRISYLLLKAMYDHPPKILTQIQQSTLLSKVDSFNGGYFGIRIFLTTPVPFTLVQMTRTFVLAFVFTFPFAFIMDESGPFAHVISIFLLTYGFFGLEMVAIELDNPFGSDDNDIDNLALAHSCMEDIYLIIAASDGPEWAQRLRKRMGDDGEYNE